MCPSTNPSNDLHDQLWFISREYQEHLKSFTHLQKEYGHLRANEWGEGLQEKIRLYSAVRESVKELIYLKGIRT